MMLFIFCVFCIYNDDVGYCGGIEIMDVQSFLVGEVLVKVVYFLVNFKDVFVGIGKGKILCQFLLNGGIDVVGYVVVLIDLVFKEGDVVLCIGLGFLEICDGGYGEYVCFDMCWIIFLFVGLSLCESMILGIVGFIVVLGLLQMQDNCQMLLLGLIVVIGVIGGVGMLVVDMYVCVGYEVYVISGKVEYFDFFCQLGVVYCVDCYQFVFSGKLMDLVWFGGVLDNVGGVMLVGLLLQIVLYGNVVLCGNVGGIVFDSIVMFFIICGVNLLGVVSVGIVCDQCECVWQYLVGDWKLQYLDCIVMCEVMFDELLEVFFVMLVGYLFGCIVVWYGSC